MKQIYKKGKHYLKEYTSERLFFNKQYGGDFSNELKYTISIYYKGLPETDIGYVIIEDEENKYRLKHLKQNMYFTDAAKWALENLTFSTLEGLFENIDVCMNEDAYNEAIERLESFE